MDGALRCLTKVRHAIARVVRCWMPLTSLMTVGVVGYISKTYVLDYVPLLYKMVEHGAHGYSSFGVTLRLIVFVFWPFMIFWTLAAIVFGDPGVIDKKFIDKLYVDYKIEADKI